MIIVVSPQIEKDYSRLPEELRKRSDDKLARFVNDPFDPQLQIKPMQGYVGLFECRLSLSHRFIFRREGDTCTLRRIGPHDILERP